MALSMVPRGSPVMPFRSEAQRKWMYAKKPEMAARWQAETPKGKLPAYVGKKKGKKRGR